MDVRVFGDGVLKRVDTLADRPVGPTVTWVDLPVGDPMTEPVLREVFECHPHAVADCLERNTTAKLRVYDDHTLVVLHVPELADAGHVHSVELDLILGADYLVTVHGPVNPVLDPMVSQLMTDGVADRMDDAGWLPDGRDGLLHAIISGLNRRMEQQLADLRSEAWNLERQVTAGVLRDPEAFLEEMFRVRLALQALKTMAVLDREAMARLAHLRPLGDESKHHLKDALDQFERVITSADVQRDYLQGIIDFYQTRINTKMTVAAERLAVIAAVTLPITALSSIMGMNVIVNGSTHWPLLIELLVVMTAMSLALLVWARRQGWW